MNVRIRRRTPTLLVLATIALMVACSKVPTACTLIGCTDGVNVQLSGSLPAQFVLTVSGGGIARTVQCSPQRTCRAEFFEGITASQVTVRIVGEGVDVTRTANAQYTTSRPNGPDCEPVCRQATVQVAV